MGTLKELLRLRDKKQKEIALELGVSQPTVSDWANGKKIPEGKNLTRLANLLEVEPSVILGINEPNKAEDGQDETWLIRERMRRDPDYRILFDAANKATPEHLRAAAAMLKALEPD